LKGAWLIAGGTGLSPRGQRLNTEVLNGKNLNPAGEVVNEKELFIQFGDKIAFIEFRDPVNYLAGEKNTQQENCLILQAANRDRYGRSLDPGPVSKAELGNAPPELRKN